MLIDSAKKSACGFTLIEVLVAIVVLAIGLLGLAKLQTSGRQYAMESYQRAQAVILLQDMVNRLNTNRRAASCYAVSTDAAAGSPWLGTGYSATPSCSIGTSVEQARAASDITQWDQMLKGASETNSGNNVGAIIGARGCIFYDAANDAYIVTLAWQGVVQTAAPAGLNCGNDQYGNEAQRRAVSAIVKFAVLS